MEYTINSLQIKFLNLSHYYIEKDIIKFDTGINNKTHLNLNKLPDYTCGIYLTWNDKKLDYRLPEFIGCGEVVTKRQLQDLFNNNTDTIIFGKGKLDVNINEILNNKYLDDNFLLLNAKFKRNDQIYTGKYVYWHLDDLDIVFNNKNEMIEYINNLPERVKTIKYFNLPPIQ